MTMIKNNSVDMVLCDLPYGTTACKWDTIIPFEPLWEQYGRVCKDNAAIVLTSRQPFTSNLIISNVENFRYTWVWDKGIPSGFMNANKMPLRGFEDICVFYTKLPVYNPQKTKGKPFSDNRKMNERFTEKDAFVSLPGHVPQKNNGDRHPTGIIKISARNNSPLHPTQKPVDLMRYLIRTYTNKGAIVLDNAMGSGTTGVACVLENRKFIGIEKDKDYFNIAKKRIES